MANIGDKFRVGETCPETGRYKHTACVSIEVYYKDNKFVPCSNTFCPNKGADWELQEKLARFGEHNT